MSQLRVLIVGASIAGPMTAYWFAKAGAKVTMIERFSGLRTSGQNIDIRTAGVTVMRKIPGMEEAVRAKVVAMDGISFVNKDNKVFAKMTATGNPDQQSLISEYEIFRGDLGKILFDLTKDKENVKSVFGEQVVSIQQNQKEDGPVKVEFQNGYPTSEYDLVVACDGATSRTRAIGLGCGVRDHIKSVNCWAAWFSIERDLLDGSKWGQGYSAVGGRFIAIGSEGGTNATLMAIQPRDNQDRTLPFRQALKEGEQALKQYVAKHYEGAGWRTDEIMKEMMDSKDFYASELVQVKTPALSKGRFAMVGDAGYCPGPTGGGTSLAMAGGYVLAGEILKHKGDLAAGLRGYEETMRPLITELQKIPPLVLTIAAPQTAWGIWIRNSILAFVSWTRIIEFVQRFFGGAFSKADTYPLPEYDWVA